MTADVSTSEVDRRTHYNGKSIHPMRPNTQMSSDVADPDSGEHSGYWFHVYVSPSFRVLH